MSVGELYEAAVEGFRSHRALAGKIALISLVVWVVYAGLMFAAVARMSSDYFVAPRVPSDTWRGRHPLVRVLANVLKNAVGLLLLVTGVAMLALPGPGLLTIVVALSVLDYPGKRRLVLRIVRERHMNRSINWIRRRANQPPIVLPDDPA